MASLIPPAIARPVVAFTPLLGSLALPLVVPLLMVRVSIGAGVLAAVVLSVVWVAAMLSSSELPDHD